jgi:acetyltransferase-like isoleucine patch superfamily enzyme
MFGLINKARTYWANKRFLKRALVGNNFICGPRSNIFLDGACREQVTIKNNVTLLDAELRCYAQGHISIGDYCWFSLRTQIISCSSVIIGSHCIFARDIYISDTNEHPLNSIVRREQTINVQEKGIMPDRYLAVTKPIKIGSDVWVGERACILKGVNIGNGAIIGANAVVTHDVPDFSVVVGNPGRIVKILK